MPRSVSSPGACPLPGAPGPLAAAPAGLTDGACLFFASTATCALLSFSAPREAATSGCRTARRIHGVHAVRRGLAGSRTFGWGARLEPWGPLVSPLHNDESHSLNRPLRINTDRRRSSDEDAGARGDPMRAAVERRPGMFEGVSASAGRGHAVVALVDATPRIRSQSITVDGSVGLVELHHCAELGSPRARVRRTSDSYPREVLQCATKPA